METVYTLSGRFAEANDQYEALSAELEDMYEANGGEVTEVTEEMQTRIDAIEALKQSIINDIVNNADSYAEIALNKAAQQKSLEAAMKEFKQQQAAALARFQAKVNRLSRSVEFWKENFDAAMKIAGLTKIGGAKTSHLHSIYYQTSKSLDVEENTVLQPYQEAIDELRAQLPVWCNVSVNINKTDLKKVELLPEGAVLVEKRSIVIK